MTSYIWGFCINFLLATQTRPIARRPWSSASRRGSPSLAAKRNARPTAASLKYPEEVCKEPSMRICPPIAMILTIFMCRLGGTLGGILTIPPEKLSGPVTIPHQRRISCSRAAPIMMGMKTLSMPIQPVIQHGILRHIRDI